MTRSSDLANLLRVRLDITPAEAQRIADCVVPVLVVDDVAGLEDPTGSLGRLAMGFVNVGGVALENGHVQLLNPPRSGVLLSVTLMIPGVGTGGAGNISFGFHDAALPTAMADTFRAFADRREPGLPVAQLRNDTNVGLLFNTIGAVRVLDDESREIKLSNPVILEPGQGVVWAGNVVNVTDECWYFWRESKRVRA